jgi:hypothetical protein
MVIFLLSILACRVGLAVAEGEMLWVGGVTNQTANFRVECAEGKDEFVVWESENRLDPILEMEVFEGVTAIEHAPLGFGKFNPDTLYHYGLKKVMAGNPEYFGKFKTLPNPNKPASFSIAFASCADVGSEHAIFTEIAKLDLLFFLHMGDLSVRAGLGRLSALSVFL